MEEATNAAETVLHLMRSRYVRFHLDVADEGPVLEPPFTPEVFQKDFLIVRSVLTKGTPYIVSPGDLVTVMSLPEDEWTPITLKSQEHADYYGRLAQLGLIVVRDLDSEPYKTLRENEEKLRANWVGIDGAFYAVTCEDYHLPWPTGKADKEYGAPPEETLRNLREKRDAGLIPPTFHTRDDAGPAQLLPLVEGEGAFYDVLMGRHSNRFYDQDRDVSLEDFAYLTRYTWGAMRIVSMTAEPRRYELDGDGLYSLVDNGDNILKKVHPSGGACHPYEVYPLVQRVEDKEPGLYFYDSQHHAIRLIREMPVDEVKAAMLSVLNGQNYAGDAAVMFVFTVRPGRHLWKYPFINRSHFVMGIEGGAIVQTFYLVAAERGLACNFSGAIHSPFGESFLGIDGYTEKMIGGLCTGHPDPVRRHPGEDRILPYEPVRHEIPDHAEA